MFLRGEIHRVSGSTAIRSMVVSRTGPFRIATCSSRKRPPYLTRGGPAPPVPLPWPVEIELALKQAELLAFVETSDRPRKYYVGRDLRRVFRLAGLARCTVRSVAFTRQAPLDPATRSFLEGYLEDLRRRTGPHLEPSLRELFNRLADPGSSQYVLSGPDLCVTCVNHVVVGVRPGRKRSQW